MGKNDTDKVKINELLERRVEKVLPSKDSLRKLLSRRKIRLYQGFDPTGGRLHLGHSIGLKKLMEFANLGHEVIFVFGTGTVLVGDPSLRDTARALITDQEIKRNIRDWKRQVSRIVDFNKVKIKQNGDWLTKLTLSGLVQIASKISAVQLFKRESFTRRIKRGNTVWYHETMYPLLQGYDSVVMDVDLEIGGTDQEFNMLIGRELQKKMNNKEKFVLTVPMILGTDGQPMSKTTGNCVWLDDTPDDMFGKLMTIPDDQIVPYATLVTDLPSEEIESWKKELRIGKNPRDIKISLAKAIVSIYHGPKPSEGAQNDWVNQFTKKEFPEDIITLQIDNSHWKTADLLVETGLASSKSEANRLLAQKGVKLNSAPVDDAELMIHNNDVLQVGKRKFARLRVK